ncbi:MAG: alpha/beta hydrolase fold protein [Microgenomates group bacterium GW2011_GWC1_37_8]|nr:MAG: alpha/beta hydrolase fold protein [Microgenomates group bacterium GW2011_GWC1_37_8]
MVFSTLAKTGKVFLITPKLAVKFRKLLYKAAREHDYEKTQGIMKEIFKKVISEDLRPLIPKIKVPTLVLWGEEDKMTPIKDAHFIKSALPGSKLVTYKRQGHKLPYEKPEQLALEIEKWYRQLS